MTRLFRSLSLALSVCGLAWGQSCGAQPQSGLASRLNGDTLEACPQARQQLQETLNHLVDYHHEEGLMHVSFVLVGHQIADVRTNRGPRQYAVQVRRAIETLKCQNSTDSPQFHRLDLNFKNVD